MKQCSNTTKTDLILDGIVRSIAYTEETAKILGCDSYNWTIEYFTPSLTTKLHNLTLALDDQGLNIIDPMSVQVSNKTKSVFIGCGSNQGVHILDGNNSRLVKTIGQNCDRDFDYMTVDDATDLSSSILYASSLNNDLVTKLDCGSGSVLGEVPVRLPTNIVLKNDVVYVISQKDACVLIIEKESLQVRGKVTVSGWSSLGGLAFDDRSRLCVTAVDESDQRFIYVFNDEHDVVCRIPTEIDGDCTVLDVIIVGNGFVILLQESDIDYSLNRIEYSGS